MTRLSVPLIPASISLVLSFGEWMWLWNSVDSPGGWIIMLLVVMKTICWIFILGQIKITTGIRE